MNLHLEHVSPLGLVAQSAHLMLIGYSLAGFACVQVVKPCQKALACLDGVKLDVLDGRAP